MLVMSAFLITTNLSGRVKYTTLWSVQDRNETHTLILPEFEPKSTQEPFYKFVD
jgi:hypothetical protein